MINTADRHLADYNGDVVIRSMYNDFLDSAKGRLLAYRKRKKRVFEFWWSGKLQSKKSASSKLNQQFQDELVNQTKTSGRKGPFTGALMVEMQFWASSRNSPEVHSLAKHYLDLLQKPVTGVAVQRNRILFRDDSQIEFLSCSYNSRTGEDSLRLRVRRLRDFFEDLELYIDIANGRVGSGLNLKRTGLKKSDASRRSSTTQIFERTSEHIRRGSARIRLT